MAVIFQAIDLNSKKDKEFYEEVWNSISAIRETVKRTGICVTCSNLEAVSIYDAYTTRDLDIKKDSIFKKLHNNFVDALAEKITQLNLFDSMHLLPIATHLSHPESPVPEAAIERDLANIRDHLAHGWGVIILKSLHVEEGIEQQLFQNIPLRALQETPIDYIWTRDGDSGQQKISQVKFIENILGEFSKVYNNKMEECPESEKNIQLNIKEEVIKEPPLSIAYYLRECLRKELQMDIFEVYGNFVCYFSPSYNLRIVAPNKAGLEFIMKYLERFGCKKYSDVVKFSKLHLSDKKKKQQLTASVIYNKTFEFLSSINVPVLSIEHYYRFRFIKMKYGLHAAQTLSEILTRLADNEYIDLRMCGGAITYNNEKLSLEGFADGKHYESKVMKARNKTSFILRRGEKIKIEEINILDPMEKIIDALSRNSPQSTTFLQPFTFMFHANFPWRIPKSKHSVKTIAECLQFVEEHSEEGTSFALISQTVKHVLGYYYSSYTFHIYESFKEVDNFEKGLDSLQKTSDTLQSAIKSLLPPASDGQLYLFTVWFLQQLVFISFLKGNFFLMEIVLQILQQTAPSIDNLTKPTKKSSNLIFHKFFGENGFEKIYNEENRVSTHLMYCEIYNMIVLPSPAAIRSMVQLAQNKDILRPKKLLGRMKDRIGLFFPPGHLLKDHDIVDSLEKKHARVSIAEDSGIPEPDVQTIDCCPFLQKLSQFTMAKLLVDLICSNEVSKNNYWSEFCRIIAFRDGSEVQGALWHTFEKKEFGDIELFFSLNYLPNVFSPKLVRYLQLSSQEEAYLGSLIGLYTVPIEGSF